MAWRARTNSCRTCCSALPRTQRRLRWRVRTCGSASSRTRTSGTSSLRESRPSSGQDKLLPNVLLCLAQDAAKAQVAGKDVWKRLQQNKDERYQFLERVPPELDALGQGMPELVVDFKQYLTLPTDELYERVKEQAKRRCRLSNGYLAHFSSRFSYFQSRVALPDEHASQ